MKDQQPNLKIEKNIPIPLGKNQGGFTELFRKMAVGDSILFPGEPSPVILGRLYTAKKEGFKFTTRTVDGGCRVWRVE